MIERVGATQIRSLNFIVNQKIQDLTNTLVSFIESTMCIEVKRMQVKYMEDIDSELLFVGLKDELVYIDKLTHLPTAFNNSRP